MPTYTAPTRTFTPSRKPKPPTKTSLDWLDKFLITAALIGIVGLFVVPLLAPKKKTTP